MQLEHFLVSPAQLSIHGRKTIPKELPFLDPTDQTLDHLQPEGIAGQTSTSSAEQILRARSCSDLSRSN